MSRSATGSRLLRTLETVWDYAARATAEVAATANRARQWREEAPCTQGGLRRGSDRHRALSDAETASKVEIHKRGEALR